MLTRGRSSLLPVAGLVAGLVAIQLGARAAGREFYLVQLTMAAYYAAVVMGLCLVMGYAGQVSLGHGAFFAVGGYVTAWLTTTPLGPWRETLLVRALEKAGAVAARTDPYGGSLLTVTSWAAVPVALASAAIVSLLIGWPALRLRGHYLAMATLGFGLIVYRVVLGSSALGAADGITGVPPWRLGFGLSVCSRTADRVANYYVAWGLAVGILVLLLNVIRSRVGRALRSIHDNEMAANAMGIDTAGFKLRAFVLSAVLAATAGCFLTHYAGGIGPSEAGAMKSIRYVVLVAAGGMANLWGALIVSAVINFLSLRGCFGTYDDAVFGVLLIAIVSWAPQGPLKPVGDLVRRLGAGRAARGGSSRAAA